MVKCNDCGCEFLTKLEAGLVTCPKCGATDEMVAKDIQINE